MVTALTIKACILAAILGMLSGCTVHFGVDYTGKTDKSNTTESPNYRRVK